MKKNLLLLILLVAGLKSFAQDTTRSQAPVFMVDKLSNHIYTATYTATIVPKGTYQLDVDMVYMSDRMGSTKLRWASLPDLKLRYGLGKRLELRGGTRIGYSNFHLNMTDHFGRGFFIKEYMIHTDYLTLGLKANLFSYNQGKGLVAVLAESHLPVLRPAEARGPAAQPSLTLLHTNQVNNWLSYHLNAGISFELNHPEYKSLHTYYASLMPVFMLSKSISVYSGISRSIVPRDIFMPAFTHYRNFNYHIGMLYTATPSIQFRASFSYDREKDWGYNGYHSNLAMAWRFN